MLYYPNTKVFDVIGSTSATHVITPATLTVAYTGNTKTLPISGKSEFVFDVKYTTGSSETGTTLDIQVQDSPDNVNFFTITNEAAAAGTSTLTSRTFAYVGGAGSTVYSFSYRLDISYKFLKISVQESGVSSNYGTVYIGAQVAGN